MKSKTVSGIVLVLLLTSVFHWAGTPTAAWPDVNETLNQTAGSKIQYNFYANDSARQVSNTGVQTFGTESFWWDELVADAKWGWDNFQLPALDQSNWGNFSNRYHHATGWDSDKLFSKSIYSGLIMYKLTGDETYLNYARWAADDLFSTGKNSTTKLLGVISNANGEIVNTASSVNHQYLAEICYLAELDSSYIDEVNECANAIIQYNFGENDENPELPVYVYPNGVQSTDDFYSSGMAHFTRGLLHAYRITNNSTYLNMVRKMLSRYWDARDHDNDPITNGTQLVPDGINSESDDFDDQSKTWVTNVVKQYRVGVWLMQLAMYYYHDQNSTIKSWLETSAERTCNYIHNTNYEGYWQYTTLADSGADNVVIFEGNWVDCDIGMLMAYDIVGNSTFIDYVYKNYNSSFQEDENNLVNGFICHGSWSKDSPATDEARWTFGFTGIGTEFTWLWQLKDEGSLVLEPEDVYAHYSRSIWYHPSNADFQNGTYGYRMGFQATNPTVTLTGSKGYRAMNLNPFMTHLGLYIRPSAGVNITWITYPNKHLYAPERCAIYTDSVNGWFNNVTFDYASKKICFDEISGSGTVTFNETIISAKKDGASYSNFSGNILNTVSGSHSYVVYFKGAPVYNVDTGLGYVTIQEAINAPETLDGHTIFVEAGAYYEKVVVNKSISLIGENRDTTIIDGSGTGTVLYVIASNVSITGFTIQNAGDHYGILISNSSYDIIHDIVVLNNWGGIYLNMCYCNSISNSLVLNNGWYYCDGGIRLWLSGFNNITNSKFLNNRVGIDVDFESDFNSVSNCTVSQNEWGIILRAGTGSNKILGTTITSNNVGLTLSYTEPNHNWGNRIYHNNLINNTIQVDIKESNCTWDNGYSSGGNYWGDHNPPDLYSGPYQNLTGRDKIGDVPYIMDGNNTDRYPLIYPYGYVPTIDLNNDGFIDIVDIVTCALAYDSIPRDAKWNPYADVNQDGIVDIVDIVMIAIHYEEIYP